MKKTLLTLASVLLLAGNAFADEVTFKPADKLGSATIDVTKWEPSAEFTFTFAKLEGASTAPAFNTAGDIRLYAQNTATLKAADGITVEKVVFTLSAQGLKRYCEVTANPGKVATQAAGDETMTWTGDAASIVFTVDPDGKRAQYGTDTDAKAGQLDFNSVTITYTKEAGSKLSAGLAFSEKNVTVDFGAAFTAPTLTKETTAAVTYTSSNEEVATVANDGNVTVVGIGTTVITASTEATDKYDAGSAEYTLVVKDPSTIYSHACTSEDCGFTAYVTGDFNPWSIDSKYGLKASAYKNSASNASEAVMGSPVLDLTGKTDIELNFKYAVNQFKENGTLIAFNQENIDKYLSIVVAVVADETSEPAWVELSKLNISNFTEFSWTYAENGPVSLNDYAGKKVRIGFKYISTTACAGTWEIDNVVVTGKSGSTAVEEVEVAETVAPVYYNLEGVRVANPVKGLYIKVEGKKATKVVL